MLEKTEEMVWLSCQNQIKNLIQKWMQLWIEINVVKCTYVHICILPMCCNIFWSWYSLFKDTTVFHLSERSSDILNFYSEIYVYIFLIIILLNILTIYCSMFNPHGGQNIQCSRKLMEVYVWYREQWHELISDSACDITRWSIRLTLWIKGHIVRLSLHARGGRGHALDREGVGGWGWCIRQPINYCVLLALPIPETLSATVHAHTCIQMKPLLKSLQSSTATKRSLAFAIRR